MEVSDVITQARDTLTVKRVFGDPYEKNGLTVIPAAKVQGGAGGGDGEGPEGQGKGSGSGFGGRRIGAPRAPDLSGGSAEYARSRSR